MILGLSESCICLGGNWILKFKKNSAGNQQNGPGMIPSNPPPQLVPLIPFLLTTIYLSQGIMLIYPTDQPIVNPTDFLSFSCLEDPDNQKCQQCAPKLLFAGWNLTCRMATRSISRLHLTDRRFQQTSLSLWSSHRSHLFLSELLKGNVWCFLLKSTWESEEPLF